MADSDSSGPMLAADGTPLKQSLNRALRRQKIRALMLVAPLLLFIMITFVVPIAQMLFRSVENQIVGETLPRTIQTLDDWDSQSGELPSAATYSAMTRDLVVASEMRNHTRVGTRLNYESTGMSSLFRQAGRDVEDFGEGYTDAFVEANELWEEPATWVSLFDSEDWQTANADWVARGEEVGRGFDELPPRFKFADGVEDALPRTSDMYGEFARVIRSEDEDSPSDEEPWNIVYLSLYEDLAANPDLVSSFSGESASLLEDAAGVAEGLEPFDYQAAFEEIDEDWMDPSVWAIIDAFSSDYTSGYFVAATDHRLTPEGVQAVPDNESVYQTLFIRTLVMSMAITFSCIALGYPIAWLLANLPLRSANVLMILVLLPFWTSLLVRTSAWKVLLQQQGVINDLLVWMGLISDANRLVMINNQTGTIIAMTHILLPFMILPLYSVMKTIPPSYLRAAKSLGATNWTAFWRVYFPQSVPGIGAGSILVFIMAIGYYITPEIVGGTKGVFISNRIAYHISTSLNWGLAAALGSILLAVVLLLYWLYDRIVGIDNVKLGG
ncbi:ABC transporter permease [Pelagovum pacificum]|uniref:ABC transporter permease n=1 Tax=Pelagovum pacificum TaxID=2588711 RepID=A0A5C5GA68_9RHOB|nr:ABC transporter permease [Pelagovum pacificum]